jgi:hypothetical protein
LSEQLANAEAAQLAAEKEAKEAAAKASRLEENSHKTNKMAVEPTQSQSSEPNGQELEAFIKAHLFRMTQPVEMQLGDYADLVDFHDKPHASQVNIAADRKQWAQKFPFRTVFANEIHPQLSAMRDAQYGWVATAVFDWRWEYRSRSGAILRGVTRDSWKIVPTADGLKITSEHSADSVTGQSKD